MHNIAIDARMLRHTGIGTYLRGLFSGLTRRDITKELDISVYGKAKQEDDFGNFPRYPFHSGIYSIQEQLEYPLRLRHCRLWHAPHYNIPFMKGKTKLVVTIHDLIHWIFRNEFFTPLQAFYAGRMFRRAVDQADHIIAVSCKTRDDLIHEFDADPEKISVIYEGVDESFCALDNESAIDRVKAKYGLPERYFLYVGSLKPHKNVHSLIRIFKYLTKQEKIECPLVLVGRKDKRYPHGFEVLTNLKTEPGIIHIPYVDADDLVALYNGAVALTHPSLYEGFGLTLLEAMACGTPVIATRSASIPEVAGDAALLVDPCIDREMMEAIVRVEKFPAIRDVLSKKGRHHVRRFRWDETAEKTAEIYEKVLTHR